MIPGRILDAWWEAEKAKERYNGLLEEEARHREISKKSLNAAVVALAKEKIGTAIMKARKEAGELEGLIEMLEGESGNEALRTGKAGIEIVE